MTNPDPAHFNLIRLNDLRAIASARPRGYVDAVLSLAVSRDEHHALLTRDAYDALRAHYNPQPLAPPPPAFDGSALWAELHQSKAPTPALVDSIAPRLPCGVCKAGWLAMLSATPPDFSSLGAWRRWTHARHEQVNAKLAKPPVSYADAALRWNW
jgi:hypothetical protein